MSETTFKRGDEVTWTTGQGSPDGVIKDGPYYDAKVKPSAVLPGPAYVVWFFNTARLLGAEVLRLKDPERWEDCPGTHRPNPIRVEGGDQWQRSVTA